jgi:hypothetical protein
MNGTTVSMNEEGHEESREPIRGSLPKKAPLPAPNTEVREKTACPMRQFTAAYKAFVFRQVERCSTPGAIVSLLRREGLYSSHQSRWRYRWPGEPAVLPDAGGYGRRRPGRAANGG